MIKRINYILTLSLTVFALAIVAPFSSIVSALEAYTVSGTLSVNSQPISNALVELLSTERGKFSTRTDQAGNYSISNVPSSSYWVDVNYESSNTLSAAPESIAGSSNAGGMIYVGNSDTTHNIVLNTNTVQKVKTVDTSGNPVSNKLITIYKNGSPAYIDSADGKYRIYAVSDKGVTGSDGIFEAYLYTAQFSPAQFRACATDLDGTNGRCADAVLNDGSQTIEIVTSLGSPSLTAPVATNQSPVLNWNAANWQIDHYDIYRDGGKIASTNENTFTDDEAIQGANNYYVVAVDIYNKSSAPSNIATVTYDTTLPTIEAFQNIEPNVNGWNNSDVTVSFTCSDAQSGVASCNTPVTAAAEGLNQTVVGSVTDNAGNAASVSKTLNIDKVVPTIGTPTWSSNPLLQGQTTTLSIPASDSLSGVDTVQYALDGGSAQAMTYDAVSNTWRATFGNSLAVSTYNVSITAIDKAGNSSVPAEDVLAVYTTTNGYVTGHAKTLPTSSDTLPIARDTSNNPAKLIIGFTNVTAPTSGSFDVNYVVRNNKDEFSLNSKSISWVVVQDSTHASVLGTADLTTYVNGAQTVTQNVKVRFDITLGVNGASDSVSMKIYNPGVDPSIGLPAYVVNDSVIPGGSNLMIHP